MNIYCFVKYGSISDYPTAWVSFSYINFAGITYSGIAFAATYGEKEREEAGAEAWDPTLEEGLERDAESRGEMESN